MPEAAIIQRLKSMAGTRVAIEPIVRVFVPAWFRLVLWGTLLELLNAGAWLMSTWQAHALFWASAIFAACYFVVASDRWLVEIPGVRRWPPVSRVVCSFAMAVGALAVMVEAMAMAAAVLKRLAW